MAVGLPVVTTDVAGTSELVLDGQTGYVVPQGDVDHLGRAMVTLVADQQLRQRMGQVGRERIEREFSFTQRLQRIEGLYTRILGLPHARSLAEREPSGAAL